MRKEFSYSNLASFRYSLQQGNSVKAEDWKWFFLETKSFFTFTVNHAYKLKGDNLEIFKEINDILECIRTSSNLLPKEIRTSQNLSTITSLCSFSGNLLFQIEHPKAQQNNISDLFKKIKDTIQLFSDLVIPYLTVVLIVSATYKIPTKNVKLVDLKQVSSDEIISLLSENGITIDQLEFILKNN